MVGGDRKRKRKRKEMSDAVQAEEKARNVKTRRINEQSERAGEMEG